LQNPAFSRVKRQNIRFWAGFSDNSLVLHDWGNTHLLISKSGGAIEEVSRSVVPPGLVRSLVWDPSTEVLGYVRSGVKRD
jgi:hypothetical protein